MMLTVFLNNAQLSGCLSAPFDWGNLKEKHTFPSMSRLEKNGLYGWREGGFVQIFMI